jgi:hypothetical protein
MEAFNYIKSAVEREGMWKLPCAQAASLSANHGTRSSSG